MWPIAAIVVAVVLLSPSGALAQEGAEAEFSFNFVDDAEGWTVGFADLPVNHDQSIYELDSGHRPLRTVSKGAASIFRDTTAATTSSCF